LDIGCIWIKAIARALDMSKNTVKSYFRRLESIVSSASCPMDIEQLLKLKIIPLMLIKT